MASMTTIVACARFKIALVRLRSPALYEQKRGMVEKHYKEILPPILGKLHWHTNELILDHGSGCGSTTYDFLLPIAEKMGSKITALDNCPAMTAHAEKNYAHAQINHVCGEITSTNSPVQDKKFNKIFSFQTLQFVDHHRKELKALNELLADDGIMFMILAFNAACFDLFAKLQQHEKWGAYAKDHMVVPEWSAGTKLDEIKLRMSFEEAGFVIYNWILEEHVYKYDKVDTYADLVLSLNSFANCLPVNDYNELKNYYRNFFAEKETKTHNPCSYNPTDPYFKYYTTIRVLAKKNV